MADKRLPQTTIKEAYYLIAKDGGFQLRKIHVEDDIVLADEKVSDPDAWAQIMDSLERELSVKFG